MPAVLPRQSALVAQFLKQVLLPMALLKMHRDSSTEAEVALPEGDIDEVRQRLFDKLQRLRKRANAQAQGQ